MIRALMTVVLLSAASISYASAECTQLTLICQAAYPGQNQATEILTRASSLADENWDEPSLENCASTVYFISENLPKTSIRIYALKNLRTAAVEFTASATQIDELVKNGQTYRDVQYSNTIMAGSVVGQTLNLGVLSLPKAIVKNQTVVNEVAVSCTVK